ANEPDETDDKRGSGTYFYTHEETAPSFTDDCNRELSVSGMAGVRVCTPRPIRRGRYRGTADGRSYRRRPRSTCGGTVRAYRRGAGPVRLQSVVLRTA